MRWSIQIPALASSAVQSVPVIIAASVVPEAFRILLARLFYAVNWITLGAGVGVAIRLGERMGVAGDYERCGLEPDAESSSDSN